jgi:cell division protease FtsH
MFVGVGASRVRDLFRKAKKSSPCIIFIDEIDAVGRQRGAGLGGSHDEREQTLNQILVEMDGFDTDTYVIVIAATNRPDVLDPALLRPGRFDRQVVIDLPDIKDRLAILEVHAKTKPLAKETDLNLIAQRTPGFSGADLSNLLNEAAILAARKNKKKIEENDLFEAVDKVLLGPERKSHILNEKEKKITAYHEAGHVAEKETFGEVTTGASNDLQRATKLAQELTTRYGMSDALGPRTFGETEEMIFLGRQIHEQKNYSEKTAEAIDKEINRLIADAFDTAKNLITSHKEKLNLIVQKLLEKETIEKEEFAALFK